MIGFFIYLLKVSGWIAVWWLIYRFFLNKETFYTFNRAYLLTGLAASFLIPLTKIRYPVEIFLTQTPMVTATDSIQAATQPFDIFSVLFYLYVVCVVFFFIRQLFLLLKINGQIRSAGYTIVRNCRLIDSSETKIPFSFNNYVFLNLRQISEEERQLILAHECSHISQRHWLDLIIMESVCILLWFNPFSWLYLRSVKENHEYLADEAVIQNGYSPVRYRAVLINRSMNTPVFSLVNTFASYKLKRISMMKKEISNPLKKLAVLLLVPAVCFFFWAFSEPEYHVTVIEPNEAPIVSQNDTIKKNDEVVVIAYGTQKKDPVVTVSQNDTIKIANSVSYRILRGSSPLFVIDGKESASSLNEVNPNQIDNITILKDASAVNVYGEKGKNGVIIISTKKISNSTEKVPVPIASQIDTITIRGSADSSEVVVRGIGLLRGASPLLIIDGVVCEEESLAKLDPNDIESIAVLKDKAAEIYGTRAKNGVILITTKKAKTPPERIVIF